MRVLLVRPWIHDFSTYDLWIQPLGLLYLGGVLIQNGFDVEYVDCLAKHVERKPDGRGKFFKQIIPTPEPLRGINRHYGRFGITPDEFEAHLQQIEKIDAILVTSGMTYWYPGVQETIQYLRTAFPSTRIFLGGIYATLMPEHAKAHSGADCVISGESENLIVPLLTNENCKTVYSGPDDYPFPAWELTMETSYRILYTSRGCPYRCTFCASDILNDQKFRQRKIDNVLEEIHEYYFEDEIRNFVFYDDALLIQHRKHLQPLLERVVESNIKAQFHTPNGLNAREVDKSLAEWMYQAGFKTIRLSLESVNPEIQKVQGNRKVTNDLFERAVRNLYRAGYQPGDLECYLIQGLPGQTANDVRDSLKFVRNLGVVARLATYSPIPGTPEAELSRSRIGDEFLAEPLLQNHSVFPLRNNGMSEEDLQSIKEHCNENNAWIRNQMTASYA